MKTVKVKCRSCGSDTQFDPGEVKVSLRVYPEEDMDYREEFRDDPVAVREIQKALAEGSEWAWCRVEVRAEWRGIVGYAHLGGCSLYADEADFRKCWGEEMEEQARLDLYEQISGRDE